MCQALFNCICSHCQTKEKTNASNSKANWWILLVWIRLLAARTKSARAVLWHAADLLKSLSAFCPQGQCHFRERVPLLRESCTMSMTNESMLQCSKPPLLQMCSVTTPLALPSSTICHLLILRCSCIAVVRTYENRQEQQANSEESLPITFVECFSSGALLMQEITNAARCAPRNDRSSHRTASLSMQRNACRSEMTATLPLSLRLAWGVQHGKECNLCGGSVLFVPASADGF